MKNHFCQRRRLTKFVPFVALLCLLSLLAAERGSAQKSQTTENKADSTLKSRARVNPSTLAMEFTLPIGSYPGRSGNALPIVLNYSSKLWEAKLTKYTDDRSETGNPLIPYQSIRTSDISMIFAKNSISGWSSSLQVPAIKDNVRIYNQYGQLYTFHNLPISENLTVGVGDIINCDGSGEYSRCHECASGWAVVTNLVAVNLPGEPGEYIAEVACLDLPGDHSNGGSGGDGGGGGDPLPTPYPVPWPTPLPQQMRVMSVVEVRMPDGSAKEFRKNDVPIECGGAMGTCIAAINSGTFLSVDGSAMRLEKGVVQSEGSPLDILYLPDGSRYVFAASSTNSYRPAEKVIDRNGNTSYFNAATRSWTDTVGRTITNPIRDPSIGSNQSSIGIQSSTIPSMPGHDLNYAFEWKSLSDSVAGGVALKYVGQDQCISTTMQSVNGSSLFANAVDYTYLDPGNTQLQITERTRACGGTIFNPVVLVSVTLPDGGKYRFEYNEFGEITKILYPTGGWERFVYSQFQPMGTVADDIYLQTNRGVHQHFVSYDGITEQSTPTTYSQFRDNSGYGIRTVAPDNSTSERYLYEAGDSAYGIEDIRSGLAKEELIYDSNGTLKFRTITEFATTGPQGGQGAVSIANRNPREIKRISITFEGGNAIATMAETNYESPGSGGAPLDPSYFAELNAKQLKSYHYLPLTNAEAVAVYDTAISSIEGKFHTQGQLASATQAEFYYNSAYRDRGFIGMPTESRILNPANLGGPSLVKTQIVYDNALPASNANYPYSMQPYGTGNSMDCSSDPQSPKICWQNPNGASGNIDLSYRGLPTTTRTYVAETDTWIETHTQYDQFGNVVKVKDPLCNEASTAFDAQYKYAYPTSTTAPAPDPDNTGHGTNTTTTTQTSYDFNTGLPLSVTNDFGQVSTTEYDGMLRPIRINPVVVSGQPTGPKTETVYGTPDSNGQFSETERFVKVRKQLDSNNWDEATTWFDGLGRTIKTQAKDSQGDVFVETHYDDFGRVDRVTNPYRAGDTVYWSKTKYDTAGRAVQTFAPATQAEIDYAEDHNNSNLTSLGTTSFDISTVNDSSGNFVGTVVMTTDASGRKSRSITNALGQLLRVDEPTATGGNETEDLGSLATPAQPTVYFYDVFGKMVRVKQGVQNRYFKYDSLGRLLRVNQPEQEINAGLDLSDSFNTDGHWTAGFIYDISGNVVRATDANGVNIINEYDRANRVIRRCYTKPAVSLASNIDTCDEIATGDRSTDTPIVEFWYDGKGLDSQQTPNFAKGKLTKVDNGISSTEYMTFDNFGRMTRSRQITDGIIYGDDAQPMTYSYNLSGALVQETYPSGRVVKNEFESDGDLARIHGKANANLANRTYANLFTYTPDGRIESLVLGNLLWEKAKFNSRLQVTELALGHGINTGDVWKLGYDYGEIDSSGNVDAAKNTGNIARQTLSFTGLNQPFVQSYKFDSLFRLIEARETSGAGASAPQTWKETFGYDRYGNRTSHAKFDGTTQLASSNITDPTIDPNTNRFNLSQGYGYDKNGNLISDAETRAFTFNADNKQSKVVQNGHLVAEYFFDGEGKRVKKKVYDPNDSNIVTEETVFVYSSGKLIAEYSTAPPSQNPTISYTATDQLGSPRVITNALGEVVSRRDFRPFGEQIEADGTYRTTSLYSSIGDNIRQKFTGYQKDDETSLDFAEARMYENRHARFTAVDPLLASGKSANPQTFNRYVYVLNNPLLLTDPNGLQVATAPRYPGGRWYQPIDSHGVLRPRFEVSQPEGYEPVTTRNKSGDLVYTPVGTRFSYLDEPEFQIRLNEVGPLKALPLLDVRTGRTSYETLTDFQRNGWEPIKGPGYQALNLATGAVQDVSLELFLAAEGLAGITRAGFRSIASEEIAPLGGSRFWSNRTSFEGTRVYQRSDIFDPNFVSKWTVDGVEKFGTNIERMASGRAPIGYDGESVVLHHILQTNRSPLAEMTSSFHRNNFRVIHINPRTFGSGINRKEFNLFRSNYWTGRSHRFR